LIAVAGDPLVDVGILKSVQFVVKDAAIFKLERVLPPSSLSIEAVLPLFEISMP
jgi:hypothetical protein